MGVVPSINVTVPVGVPAPGETALTVAVKWTGWPKTEGFWLEATVVELSALLTVSIAAVVDELALKFVSPL
jgi:hypothetical protein